MKYKENIYFCTHSNLDSGSFGDSNNDLKFINAIPKKYNIIKIFPNQKGNRIVNLIQVMKEILSASLRVRSVFITRLVRPAYIPLILKILFKHKVYVYLGCTPLIFVEKQAFAMNPQYASLNSSVLNRIILNLEFLLEKFVLRNADHFFVENEKAKKMIMKFGASPSKISILPYYVQDYMTEYHEINYTNNNLQPFIIGYTGRFHKYDNLPPLIDSISLLKKEGYNIKLKLIGDGITRKKIEKKVIQNKLTQEVEFLGPQSHREVANLMKSFHCLILPMASYICPSTIAIKILEGVLMGKLIITNNSGNNKSLFGNVCNLVLNGNASVEDLSNKIKNLIDNFDNLQKLMLENRDIQIKKHTKDNYFNQIRQIL